MTVSTFENPTIPWPLVPLKRVLRFRNGEPYAHVESNDGDYPVYGSGGEFARADDYLYDGTSVLFGRKGTVDKPMLVRGRFWCIDTMFYTRLDPSVDARFVHYFATTIPYTLLATDTARPSMTQTDLGEVKMPFPTLQEQRAIADFLDRETAQIDAMIEAQEVLILRISEYDSAWRAYAVLPLLGSGDRLKTAMFETEERANDAADSLPLLSVSIDWGVRRRDETSTNQAASEDLSKYKVVCKGDIVLNRMRAFQGALGHSDEDGIVSPDYAVFRAREGVSPEWLSSIMRSAPFIEEMASRIRGIGSADSGQVRTPRLNARDLLDIRLALPSQAAQEDALADWRERTGEVERVLDAASEGVRLLRERRDALITAAVTGRIDPTTEGEAS